jgi:hypothetical protein
LAEIHRDNLLKLRMDLFTARDDGDFVDEDGDPEKTVDAIEDAVAAAHEYCAENIRTTLAQFDHFLDTHVRADIP